MAVGIAQIRHENFMLLYRQFCQSQRHLPERGLLKLFATQLAMSDRYLSHIKCNRKNIGNTVARGIELALALPAGWLDHSHAAPAKEQDGADAAEKMFLETVKLLYRAEPEAMRKIVLDQLQRKLVATG